MQQSDAPSSSNRGIPNPSGFPTVSRLGATTLLFPGRGLPMPLAAKAAAPKPPAPIDDTLSEILPPDSDVNIPVFHYSQEKPAAPVNLMPAPLQSGSTYFGSSGFGASAPPPLQSGDFLGAESFRSGNDAEILRTPNIPMTDMSSGELLDPGIGDLLNVRKMRPSNETDVPLVESPAQYRTVTSDDSDSQVVKSRQRGFSQTVSKSASFNNRKSLGHGADLSDSGFDTPRRTTVVIERPVSHTRMSYGSRAPQISLDEGRQVSEAIWNLESVDNHEQHYVFTDQSSLSEDNEGESSMSSEEVLIPSNEPSVVQAPDVLPVVVPAPVEMPTLELANVQPAQELDVQQAQTSEATDVQPADAQGASETMKTGAPADLSPPPAVESPRIERRQSIDEVLMKVVAEAHKLKVEVAKDEQVRVLLREDKGLSAFPWVAPIVKGTETEQNPYMDPTAVSYSMQTEYVNDFVVKLFSQDCCYIRVEQPVEPPMPEMTMDSSLLFKSEATEMYPAVSRQVAEGDIYDVKLLPSFFFQQPKPTEVVPLNLKPIVPLPTRRFLRCELEDFSLAPGKERVEPVLCSAFLMRRQEVISEPWHFTSIVNLVFTSSYLQLDANTKGAFELPEDMDDVYFILLLQRPLMAKAGEAVNKYYLSGDSKKSSAVATVDGWQSVKDVWTTFAWTYSPLKELVDVQGLFQFQRPFIAPHTLTLKVITKTIAKGGVPQLPFNVCITAKTIEATHGADILDCDVVLASTVPWPSVPRLTFENRMLITLNSVNLQKIPSSLKSPNICVKLALETAGKPVSAFVGRFSKQKTSFVTSRCSYHEKKPTFMEVYVLSLPYSLDPNLTLNITVFHASPVKPKKGKKASPPKALFKRLGAAQFQLAKDGVLIPDGPYQIPLDVGPDKEATNFVSISVQSRSSWHFMEEPLHKFTQTFSVDDLQKCSEYALTVNLLELLEFTMTRILDRTLDALKAMCVISLKVKENLQFTDFAMGYARHFVFRDAASVTPDFHRKVLAQWAELIRGMDPQEPRPDRLLIEFLFAVLIKSIYMTKDRAFENEFCSFASYWSVHEGFSPVEKAKNDMALYAQFLNMLYDIGLCSFAVHGIIAQVKALDDSAMGHTVLIYFLEQVWRPKLFYTAVVVIDPMNKLILSLIAKTKVPRESPTLENIFILLMHLFEKFTHSMCERIAARQIGLLDILSPLGKIHYASRMDIHPVLVFFALFLNKITKESFSLWWSRGKKDEFFESLHFLLDKVRNNGVDRVKEIVYATHFGIWKVLKKIIELNDEFGIIGVTNVIYHFFWCDIPVDFYQYLADLLIRIIQSHFPLLMEKSQPVITKHLVKVFQQSRLSRSMTDVIRALFEVDQRLNGNTRRSMSVCCLALSFLSTAEIRRVQMDQELPITPIINTLVEVENVMIDPQLSQELQTEKIWLKAITLIHSPDATIKVLSKLKDIHASNEYYAEEIQTMLLQAAIIVEYMVKQGRLNVRVFDVDVPSSIFWDLCPTANMIKCTDDMCFHIPSYCDSEMFSYRSLVNHLAHIVSRCIETQQLEMGYLLIDKLWPLFEDKRMFSSQLPQLFKSETQIVTKIGSIPSDTDRLFGKYYRICLYGTLFEQEDGSQFIYREKKLTHLFTLSDRLVDEFSHKHPGKQIELIKASGEVDRSTLDPSVGYIQITSVVPYFSKNELHMRMTQYEQNHLLSTFYYDTPFTKEGNQQQGSIDKQWIRRTLLTVDEAMPSVLKRRKIASKTEKEYEPIRVAYRQLRMRNNGMRSAVEQSDYRHIQQLLHGSLLTQVNEGPSKMAEVFLGPNTQKTRAHEKLKRAFEDFLKINGEALGLHARWVSQNPTFMALHHELESGFSALTDRLAEYIHPVN